MSPDGQVITQLERAGSDLTKPHHTKFYFYLPSKEGAEAVATELRSSQFATEVRVGAFGKDWLCLAKKNIVPTIALFDSLRVVFNELASKHHGEYDGWEAEVSK